MSHQHLASPRTLHRKIEEEHMEILELKNFHK
jgi:hypothetical protein